MRVQQFGIAGVVLLLALCACNGQLQEGSPAPAVPRPDAAPPTDGRRLVDLGFPPEVAPADVPRPPPPPPDANVAPIDTNTGPCVVPNLDGVAGVVGTFVAVDPAPLGPDAVADRLVKWLFGTGPQADVTARIAGCQPLTAGHVRALASQLLLDPRAQVGLFRQFQTWLAPDGVVGTQVPDPAIFPPLSPELRASMLEEVGRLGLHVVTSPGNLGSSFEELLTAQQSFLDGRLAALYGVAGIAPAAPFALVPFPPEARRSGVLTTAVVASFGMTPFRHSPPTRGRLISERLLCADVPDPPAFLPPNIMGPDPGKTLRQTFAVHLKEPSCGGCHALLDVGWALEPFDALGRLRQADNGLPIDSTATLRSHFTGRPQSVNGPRELGQALARLPEAGDCFVDHMFAIALGFKQPLIDRLASNTTPTLHSLFAKSGNVRELLLDIATTADFHRQRR